LTAFHTLIPFFFCGSQTSILLEAKDLLAAWGFTYRDVVFIWEKLYKNGEPVCGMGWTTRRNCELMLIAYKNDRKVKIVHARKDTKHASTSKSCSTSTLTKPDIFRKLITDLYGGKNKIELFARVYPDSEHFNGWDVWETRLALKSILLATMPMTKPKNWSQKKIVKKEIVQKIKMKLSNTNYVYGCCRAVGRGWIPHKIQR
jgi:N6-adenosine-specific RNA methylase IME4